MKNNYRHNIKHSLTLVGKVCSHCGYKIFPPRDVCPNCGSDVKDDYVFSGKGEIYSFTTIYKDPGGIDSITPYISALVKLVEGPMITAQLTDVEDEQAVEIGMLVEMVTRKIRNDGDEQGKILYGYKFRPQHASGNNK
jgi:uncharacterized OB-fold protein